jgi:hypothetical protein
VRLILFYFWDIVVLTQSVFNFFLSLIIFCVIEKMAKPEEKSNDPEIGGFIAMMTYFCYFILVVVSLKFIISRTFSTFS